MPDRRLVVFEADPGAPEYGQMRAIAPNKAGGIPIPTFGMGPTTPAVGNSVGEAFFNSTIKMAYVWDGAAWRSVVKDPFLSFATDALLLADTTAGLGSFATSQSSGNIFVKKPGGWHILGIAEYSSVTNLLADAPSRGTLATALDDNSTWEMTATGWRCLVIRHFANTAGVSAWAGAGAKVGDIAVADDVDVLYMRTAAGWRPRTIWADTEANIRAATWALDGQEAFSTDTGKAFDRIGGRWVEEPIAHFATEALLLAATLPNGTLAWSDDTNVVFVRAAGAWKRLQGPQISVGTTAPTTPGTGDQYYDKTKSQLFIWDGAKWETSGTEDLRFKEGEITIGADGTAGNEIILAKNLKPTNDGVYMAVCDADLTAEHQSISFHLLTSNMTGAAPIKELHSHNTGSVIELLRFYWKDSADSYVVVAKFSASAVGKKYRIGMMSPTADLSAVVLDGSTRSTSTSGSVIHPGQDPYTQDAFKNAVKEAVKTAYPTVAPPYDYPHTGNVSAFYWRPLKHGMREVWFGHADAAWDPIIYMKQDTSGKKKHFWNTVKLITGTGVFEKTYDQERTSGAYWDWHFGWEDDNNKVKASREVMIEFQYFHNLAKDAGYFEIHARYRRASDDSHSLLWTRIEFDQKTDPLTDYAINSYVPVNIKSMRVT